MTQRKPDTTRSNAAVAVDRLRDLIFDGRLPAGSDHLETELALLLGMSRTPIHEAALTLAAQGLVEVRPRKGIRILPLTPMDMAEIYDVLTVLEGLAANDAAQAGLGPQDLAPLTATIDAMDAALDREDRAAWATADAEFHAELMRLGGNRRAQQITAMMSDQVRRARAVTLYLRPLPVASNSDHRAVLDAINRGDPAAAHRIHTAHRKAAKRVLLDLLETHQLHQI